MSDPVMITVSDLDMWHQYSVPHPDRPEIEADDLLGTLRRETGYRNHLRHSERVAGEALRRGLSQIRADAQREYIEATAYGERFLFRFPEDMEFLHPGEAAPVQFSSFLRQHNTVLEGGVDALGQVTAIAWRFQYRPIDLAYYSAGIEWKAYLHVMGAERFRYLVFRGEPDGTRRGMTMVTITDVQSLLLWRYDGMGYEVESAIGSLAQFHREWVAP